MAKLKSELGKPQKDGSRKLYIILSHACTRKRIPTSITVTPKEISKKTGKIISPSIQSLIDDTMNEYRKRINKLDLELTGERVDAEYIYERIINNVKRYDFFEFTENWLKTQDNRKRNYRTMLNNLERYVGKRQLPFDKITYAFLVGYSDYLQPYPRARTHYLGLLRHIHNLARKTYNTEYETVISGAALEKFDFPRQQVKGGRALDIDTLIRVFQYKPQYKLDALTRDCAILSFCLMGTNSCDLYNARSFKNGIIAYNRTKTAGRRADGAYIEINVHERLLPLFKKYSDTTHVFSFHRMYCDHDSFNKYLNKGLKRILKQINSDIAEENKSKSPKDRIEQVDTLQFYQFRHSWATIARNELGIDKYTVHAALNHVDDTTRIDDVYIKQDFRLINDANRKVLDYVFSILDDRGGL